MERPRTRPARRWRPPQPPPQPPARRWRPAAAIVFFSASRAIASAIAFGRARSSRSPPGSLSVARVNGKRERGSAHSSRPGQTRWSAESEARMSFRVCFEGSVIRGPHRGKSGVMALFIVPPLAYSKSESNDSLIEAISRFMASSVAPAARIEVLTAFISSSAAHVRLPGGTSALGTSLCFALHQDTSTNVQMPNTQTFAQHPYEHAVHTPAPLKVSRSVSPIWFLQALHCMIASTGTKGATGQDQIFQNRLKGTSRVV